MTEKDLKKRRWGKERGREKKVTYFTGPYCFGRHTWALCIFYHFIESYMVYIYTLFIIKEGTQAPVQHWEVTETCKITRP